NLPDRDGLTPFDRALAARDFPLARRLAALGGLPAGGSWNTPLWNALRLRDREAIGFLLSLGASPDTRAANGLLPAEHAIDADEGATLHLLLSYGAETTGLFERTRRPGRSHLGSLILAHGSTPANPPPPSIDTPLAA